MMEFFIDAKGNVTESEVVRGNFGSRDEAADFCIRFAQNCDSFYRIFYV